MFECIDRLYDKTQELLLEEFTYVCQNRERQGRTDGLFCPLVLLLDCGEDFTCRSLCIFPFPHSLTSSF